MIVRALLRTSPLPFAKKAPLTPLRSLRWCGSSSSSPSAATPTPTPTATASTTAASSSAESAKEDTKRASHEVPDEEFPKEVPMTGIQLRKWMAAEDFGLDIFARGMEQAYRAVAYVNSVEDDELGVERWTRLPVDAVALEQLASYDDKTNDYNGAKMTMRVADPSDRLLAVSLRELTLKDNGEIIARVQFHVVPNSRALYGNDIEAAKNLMSVLIPHLSEEENASLSDRLLECIYALYLESGLLSSDTRKRMRSAWADLRSKFATTEVTPEIEASRPGTMVYPLRMLCLWVLRKSVRTRRAKQWTFRKSVDGHWHLSKLDIISEWEHLVNT